MDMREKDKFEVANRSGDHLNYQSSDLSSSEWQFGNQPLAIVSPNPSIAVRQGTQMGSSASPSSVSMVNSFHSTLWNQPTNSSSLGGIFMQTGSNTLPPSLSNFPTDSAFIERAARFSCFNGRNFSGVSNPFSRSEPLSPYSNASRGDPGDQNRESESPTEDQRCKGSLRGVGVLSNEPGEPEFSGRVQEETAILSGVAGDGKKRKRTNQDMELDQVEGGQQLSVETSKENSSTMETPKLAGKQAKDSSDSPKEDYIHVRARRGQATNSHSLAERVRREKISERMKFLQDLVPGCSKVTGKAVMLDEIINYVQSLQRQVEFLSMKLATVNQKLDFNIEGLLSKDFIQSRIGSSSTMGFSHDMIHPQLRPPQYGLVQVQGGMSSATHLPEALRRAINVPLTMPSGYKEHTPQIPGSWDEELHNVFQMNLGATNPTLDATQELTGKPRDGYRV